MELARKYCREVTELRPDAVPIAPHIYCTQFLDDRNPVERAEGLEMGLALLRLCSEVWVYGADNLSEGMRGEIEYAKKNGIPVFNAEEVYKRITRPDADRRVYCGAYVPEGRHVCPTCELRGGFRP